MLRLRSLLLVGAALTCTFSVALRSARADGEPARPPAGAASAEAMESPLHWKIRMLGNERVQKELRMTDRQKSSFQKLLDDSRKMDDSLRGLSPDQRKAKIEELQGKAKEFEKDLDNVLDKKQWSRLKQIGLQLGGFAAWPLKEFGADLKLTDDQKAKLKDLLDDCNKQMGEHPFVGGTADAETLATLRKIRKASNKKGMDVLTSQQRTKLKKMEGKKIDFDMYDLGH
jgi:Spy/CpxP family protein refolding chaperone